MTSTLAFSTAAYLTPSSSLGGLLLFTAAMSFAVIPFTGIVMMPVNNELVEIHKAGSLQGDSKTPSNEDGRVLQVVEKWRKLHMVRLALGAGAWIAGLGALVVCM
jgi:hypothetical protein